MAEAATVAQVVTPPAPRYRASPHRIKAFNFDGVEWNQSIDVGVPFEAILRPEYWASVAWYCVIC